MPILLIIVGIISGVVSGLGMGGGTILVLVLSNFLQINQHMAQATNLIYFIPTSIAAIWVYWKNKNLDKKIALKMIPLGIAFGVLGSYIANLIDAKSLKKYFGIFLLVIGVYEMFITVKNKLSENKKEKGEKIWEILL